MTGRTALAGILAVLGTAAGAVGLGPLSKSGVIDGPREAFFLTLYNPYDQAADFVAYPVSIDDETAQPRVEVSPAQVTLGAHRTRQLLVVAGDLAIGETYMFRVCAERRTPTEGMAIHARVCSKLSARRVG